MGRFLQADTVVPGAGNPQALNRYSYVLNGPLKYTDPSGYYYCTGGELDAAACKTWVESMLRELDASGATGAELVLLFRQLDAYLMSTTVSGCYGGCQISHPGVQFDFTPFVSGGMVTGYTVSLNERYAVAPLSNWDLSLVGHELTHLLKQDTYRISTRGEAEAYAAQGRILLDLNESPTDEMKLAMQTKVNDSAQLEAFRQKLVAWALTVDLPTALVYSVEPNGAKPAGQPTPPGPVQPTVIRTPSPRPGPTPK